MNDDPAAAKARVPLAAALRQLALDLQQQTPPPELQARVLARVQERLQERLQEQAHERAHGRPPERLHDQTPGAAGAVGSAAAQRGPQALVVRTVPGPPRRRYRALAWSGAAACATVLAAAGVPLLRPLPPVPAMAPAAVARSSGFVSLVPAERWPTDAAAGWIVSTELQGDRLAALGLPFDPAHAGDSVRAELLVRQSGEVLAVRFIR